MPHMPDNNIDPNGPPPMEYHARMEWLAQRSGNPPTNAGPGGAYSIPTNYGDRMAQRKAYRDKAAGRHKRKYGGF